MKALRILAATTAAVGWLAAGAVHGQTAPAAPQYSPSDFAKSMLADPPSCESESEADCQAQSKTRGFSLPTLSAKALNAAAAGATAKAKPKSASIASAAAPAAPDSTPPRPKVLGGANVLVTFNSGSAEITPQGRANLKSVAEGMRRPALANRRFEVAGYTDPRGGAAVNMPLSQSRAEAVKAFLVGEGVEASRLTAAGYGSDPMVAPDRPADERNRRVEIHRLD